MKTMIKKLLLLLVFLPCSMMAQTMSGVVSDAMGPLPGVNIVVQGTSNGTATDFDGNYSLSNLKNGDVVVFSFMGFKDFKVTYAGQAKQNVTMAEDAQALEEVVVVGYGSVKKKDATGSVALVTAKDFNKGAITSVDGLLNGRSSGVVVTSSGTPGNDAVIRVRGSSSLLGGNDPLIVVDGLPIAGGLSSVNPNDIASFSILKDASATAIYGNRGSNGVILITTKKGSAESIKVSVNMFSTYNTLAQKIDVYNASEFRSLIERQAPNELTKLGGSNTDWQDEIFENTFTTDVSASVLGSVFGKVPARLTLANNNNNGILITSQFQRSTASFSLNPTFFKDKLKVNVAGNYAYTYRRNANEGAIGAALSYDPTQSVKDPNSPYGGYTEWIDPNTNRPTGVSNPVSMLLNEKNKSNKNRFFGNLNVEYDLPYVNGLKAIVNYGVERDTGNGRVIVNHNSRSGYYDMPGGATVYDFFGSKSDSRYSTTNFNANYQLNYKKEIGKFDIDLLGGYEYQQVDWKNYNSSNYYDPTSFPDLSIGLGDNLQAFLGRLNLGYNDKYLLTYNFRRDGSSKLSPVNVWANFNGFAFAWKMKEESFLKDSNIFSDIKLRLSYGENGNRNSGYGELPWLKLYNIAENTYYSFGSEDILVARPDGYNENLVWERSAKYNIGFDLAFLKDKLKATVDYYQSQTTDLYSTVPYGALQNLEPEGPNNVGQLDGKGLELGIDYEALRTDNSSLNFNYNFSYNKLEIVDLVENLYNQGGVGLQSFVQTHSVGYAPYSYRVYQQVYGADGRPLDGVYVDRNNDGEITDEDKYIFDKPQADFTMGFMTNATYKKWDFSMAWRASIGNYVYDDVSAGRAVTNSIYNPQNPFSLNNTTVDYDNTNFSVLRKESDYYIKDGSFLKLDNVTIGYTLDKVFSDKSSVRVYGGVQNALIFTKYKGLDPEVFNNGIDGSIYPRARMYLVGANINF